MVSSSYAVPACTDQLIHACTPLPHTPAPIYAKQIIPSARIEYAVVLLEQAV